MSIDLDELKEMAETSLPDLRARRLALQALLIGKPLEERPPLQRDIDDLLLQEFLVKRIQSDIAASENAIGDIDPAVKERLDQLAAGLDDAIVLNARLSGAVDTATAFGQAVKAIQS